jgi:hypothetical protein
MADRADVTTALGRLSSAQGAVALAVAQALADAERREREAARRETQAAASIAESERRVEHLLDENARLRDGDDKVRRRRDYLRGYSAGHSAARRGAPADGEAALERTRDLGDGSLRTSP